MGDAVRTVSFDDLAVVHVTGELDVQTAPALRDELAGLAAADHHDVVVDLTDVTFMDSTGISVLVTALKRIRTIGGRMDLVVPDAKVLRVLRITGLNQVFTVHHSLGDALAARTP